MSQQAPLPDAEISVAHSPFVTTPVGTGASSSATSPSGRPVVRVRWIGHQPQQLGASLAAGEVKTVEIVMEGGIYQLPELAEPAVGTPTQHDVDIEIVLEG